MLKLAAYLIAVYSRALPVFFALPGVCLVCVLMWFKWGLYTCQVVPGCGWISHSIYIHVAANHVCSRNKALLIYRYFVPCFHCKPAKQNQKLFFSKINNQAGKGFQPIFNNKFVCLENSTTFVSTKQKEHEKHKDKRQQSKCNKNRIFWRRKHANSYCRACIGYSRGAQ